VNTLSSGNGRRFSEGDDELGGDCEEESQESDGSVDSMGDYA
jgi:hypothetical protein